MRAGILCREGLHVSLDFFDDIFIPEHALKDPQFFDEVRLTAPVASLALSRLQRKPDAQVSLPSACKWQHTSLHQMPEVPAHTCRDHVVACGNPAESDRTLTVAAVSPVCGLAPCRKACM